MVTFQTVTISRRMLKHFLLFMFSVLATAGLWAQQPVQIVNPCLQQACYWATTSATVNASSSTTLTIQQPATGGRQVIFNAAVVQCPGQAFTVDQAQNGTGATATAGTATALVPTTATAAAKVFTASNVGSGTATSPSLSYTSGSIGVVDLSQRTIGNSGITNNYSVKLTNSGTASCTGSISIYWSEKI